MLLLLLPYEFLNSFHKFICCVVSKRYLMNLIFPVLSDTTVVLIAVISYGMLDNPLFDLEKFRTIFFF